MSLEVNKIYQGDCLEITKTFPDNFIDCVICSPPYWGLRHYQTIPQIWDNHNGCEHEWGNEFTKKQSGGDISKYWKTGGVKEFDLGMRSQGNFCLHCNAWRGELGLEPTFQLYLEHLFQIFTEIKRVLKKTGTCWINLGDCYAGAGGMGSFVVNKAKKGMSIIKEYNRQTVNGVGNKSLIGIPQRFMIQMIDSGWICRNNIIWHKPNAMPESAKDRFTDDYENVFFFVKNQKYYFEQQFEPYLGPLNRWGGDECKAYEGKFAKQNDDPENYASPRARNLRPNYPERDRSLRPNDNGRNKRTVWTIPTQPSSEPHFATYPEDLIIPMVKAGCPKDGVVLDPFAGIGTTCIVAKKLGCQYIGIELSEKYSKIAERKLNEFEMLPL